MSFTSGNEQGLTIGVRSNVCCGNDLQGPFDFRPVAGGKGRLFEVMTPTKRFVRELVPAKIEDIKDQDLVSGVLAGLGGVQGRQPVNTVQRESLSPIDWRSLAGRRGSRGR